MVQRKITNNKLGIQADHVKSDKRLANLVKPFSHHHHHQHQDGKSRGGDHLMKKKMKKSRSIKLSDIESLKSSPLKNTFSLPGKPPPVGLPTVAAMMTTPQKQSPMKTNDRSPNYMKSTSSSEARRGSTSQVRKNLFHENSSQSKLSSGSGNRTVRGLTKTSSLKLVRTLTKTPSFKHVRASVIKCSSKEVVRATCSSTLKDSKFPDYLVLSPGGNEVEGTSVMKVCPYTYCSLNGHHHKPSPPLKRFLSARRRMLKTQKSMNLEALSPRIRSKQEIEEVNEKKRGPDFFIEIYAKTKENNPESPSGDRDEAEVEKDYYKQVGDDLCDGSPHSETDEANAEQAGDTFFMGVDMMEGLLVEQKAENAEKEHSTGVAINEAEEEFFDSGSEFEEEFDGSSEEKDSTSEVIDMEWEEGQFSTTELNEVNRLTDNENESDLADGYISELKNQDCKGEPTNQSDNNAAHFGEEILADEVSEDESKCFNMESNDSDSEMDCTNKKFEIAEAGTHCAGLMVACALTESDETQEENLIAEAEDKILETNQKPSLTYETLQHDDVVTNEPNSNRNEELENSEMGQTFAVNDFGIEEKIANKEEESRVEETKQVNITRRSIGIQVPDTSESFLRIIDLSDGFFEVPNLYEVVSEAGIQEDSNQSYDNSSQDVGDEILVANKILEEPSEGEHDSVNVPEKPNPLEKDEDEDEAGKFNTTSSKDCEEQSDSTMRKSSVAEKTQVEQDSQLDKAKAWTIISKKRTNDDEDERKFNPREPNYLPAVADPDAEKVDLRPQIIDDRKNAEEWMVDYALRQTVTKLAPARKRKVALLVEAFEAVTPIPKYGSNLRHPSTAFVPARTIQACS